MLIPYTNIDTKRTKINEPQSCALGSLKSTDFEFLMKSCIKIIKNKINIFVLFLTGLLVSINWFTWLYAVSTNNLLDSALGYYIFPILSVFFIQFILFFS